MRTRNFLVGCTWGRSRGINLQLKGIGLHAVAGTSRMCGFISPQNLSLPYCRGPAATLPIYPLRVEKLQIKRDRKVAGLKGTGSSNGKTGRGLIYSSKKLPRMEMPQEL